MTGELRQSIVGWVVIGFFLGASSLFATAAKVEVIQDRVNACGQVDILWSGVTNDSAATTTKPYLMLARRGTPITSSESIYLLLNTSSGSITFPTFGLRVDTDYVIRALTSDSRLIAESNAFQVESDPACLVPDVEVEKIDRKNGKVVVRLKNLPAPMGSDTHWLALAKPGAANSSYLDFVSLKPTQKQGRVTIPLVKGASEIVLEVRLYLAWRKGILNYRPAVHVPILEIIEIP
jgi:hypothetical protein